MLDRLMCRAVLAEADRIVRHHVDDALLHQRGQPDRRTAVIREDEERAAVGNEQAVECQAVHRRGHAMLAHAVVDVVAGEISRRDRRVVLRLRAVRAREIRRAADQLGQRRHERFERHLRPYSRRALCVVGCERRLCLRDRTRDGSRDACGRRSSAFDAAAASPFAARSSSRREPWRPSGRRRARPTEYAPESRTAGSGQPSFSRAPLISSAPERLAVGRCFAGLGRRAESRWWSCRR